MQGKGRSVTTGAGHRWALPVQGRAMVNGRDAPPQGKTAGLGSRVLLMANACLFALFYSGHWTLPPASV